MKSFLFVIIIIVVPFDLYAQSQSDAEKFIKAKLEKYTDPKGFDVEISSNLDNSQIHLISYLVNLSENGLIIKSVTKTGSFAVAVEQVVNLKFFKSMDITSSGGRYVMNFYTEGNHCYSKVSIPEIDRNQESKRKADMSFPLFKGIELENNSVSRLNKALNDLKIFYSGEEKY